MALILPKGIVVNTDEISEDIIPQHGDSMPIDQIVRMWKVYTTTQRRLLDPTAKRLENFWWRIFGSRHMKIDAHVVARLFLDISSGPTFVPLRGPSNRDETGNIETALTFRPKPEIAAGRLSHDSDSSVNPPASNSSREQSNTLPPILKKSNGSSGAGPRHTARFISPQGSDDERSAQNHSGSKNSSSIATRSPVQDGRLRISSSIDDVATATRPRNGSKTEIDVADRTAKGSEDTNESPRRNSSQAPPETLSSARAALMSKTRAGSHDMPAGDDGGATISKFRERFSLSPEMKVEKESSKRTKSSKVKSNSSKSSSSSSKSTGTSSRGDKSARRQQAQNLAGPSRENIVRSKVEEDEPELDEDQIRDRELQEMLLREANANLMTRDENQRRRKKSNEMRQRVESIPAAYEQFPNLSNAPQPRNNEKRPSDASTVKDSVTSSLMLPSVVSDADWDDDYDEKEEQAEPITFEKGKGKSPNPDFFAKRPIPPLAASLSISNISGQMAKNTADGLARSKSQITLMIEEERAKKGGGS